MEPQIDRSDVIKKLKEFHYDRYACDLEMDVTFRDQDYDSLDFVELIMMTEREYNICIPDQKLPDVATPNDLVSLVCEHLPQ